MLIELFGDRAVNRGGNANSNGDEADGTSNPPFSSAAPVHGVFRVAFWPHNLKIVFAILIRRYRGLAFFSFFERIDFTRIVAC